MVSIRPSRGPHIYLNVSFLSIGTAGRSRLGSLPNPGCLPELPIFSMAADGQSSRNRPHTTIVTEQPGVPGTSVSTPLAVPGSRYDPTAALPPKLVTRILNLEFIEMAELIPDAWHEDAHASPDRGEAQRRRPRRSPVTDIMTWLQCFARMAAVLATKYPDKAPEMCAYQSVIVRAARNYEGQAWVAYDRQFRREALARRDLNWSMLDLRLYIEAFTGRARAIARCSHCLSEAHGTTSCPANPYQPLSEVANLAGSPGPRPAAGSRQEICRSFNEGRCRFLHCKYLHICKDCYHPHPWIACQNNPLAIHRKRPRSPRRAYPKGMQQ